MNLPAKEYLGDGVYVEFVDGMLRLTTENGIRVTNEVFLEPEVFDALLAYAKRVAEAGREGRER